MFDKASVFYISCVKWFALGLSSILFVMSLVLLSRSVTLPNHTSWNSGYLAGRLDVGKIINREGDGSKAIYCSEAESADFRASIEELDSTSKFLKEHFNKAWEEKQGGTAGLIELSTICTIEKRLEQKGLDRSFYAEYLGYATAALSNHKGRPIVFITDNSVIDGFANPYLKWKSEQRDFSVDTMGAGIALGFFTCFVFMTMLLVLVRIEGNTRKISE